MMRKEMVAMPSLCCREQTETGNFDQKKKRRLSFADPKGMPKKRKRRKMESRKVRQKERLPEISGQFEEKSDRCSRLCQKDWASTTSQKENRRRLTKTKTKQSI